VNTISWDRSTRVELACFGALASLAALQWASLVADPPIWGVILSVALATAVGGALAARASLPLSRRTIRLVVAGVAISAVLIGMLAVGLPARMLLPGHWDELSANIGQSLDGLGDVATPYTGADLWTRLAILLAAPLTVGIAALATFWPMHHHAAGRTCGLILLVGLYLVAVAWARPANQLAGGALLLLLVCTWLWLPGIARGRWLGASLAIATAAAVALPVTAAIDRGGPLLDYRHWNVFRADARSFSWDQSYGPLNWPQEGTRMLVVASDGAHYWKVTNLDEFDGVRWVRSARPGPEPALGQPRTFHPKNESPQPAAEWVDRINLEVRGLSSEQAIGAGTVLALNKIEGRASLDAVWETTDPLDPGDSYTALVYDPEPSEAEMRAAGTGYPAEAENYVSFTLPGALTRSVEVPLWGPTGPASNDRQAISIDQQVSRTAYEGMYSLARQLAAGAATPYEAVRRIERYLQSTYDYRQNVPDHTYPLPAFLSEDRAGYCQQFSGAMALMLRMLGIPSRVAAGFSPGARDPKRNTFLVEDTDAHNWVEVFFPGIGWVTFDPTPGDAPAATQLDDDALGVTHRGPVPDIPADVTPPEPTPEPTPAEGPSESPQRAPEKGGGAGAPTAALALGTGAALALVALGMYVLRARHRRRLPPDQLADAELAELGRSLASLGAPLPPGTTLLRAERFFERSVGPGAAAYAARLRARRYRDPGTAPPGVAERRALRRELISRAGWRRRLRVLRAIPPGGPSRR
jgi:transglutaminase-like putative cysteine protease